MTDIQQRVREAYDAQHLPEALRARTLAAIEEARAEGGASPVGNMPETMPPTATQPSALPAVVPAASAHSTRSRRRPRRRFALGVAACLVLVLAVIGAFGAYQTPAAYVGISVNPSIELTVNPFGKVIAARGLNEDGETVLAEVALDHLSYEEAIVCLVESPAFSPYLTADAMVDVAIASDDQRLGSDLAEQTDRVLAKMPCAHRCHRADGAQCAGKGADSEMGHGQGHGQGHGRAHGRHSSDGAE